MTGMLVAPLGPPERLFALDEPAADGDRVRGAMRVEDWMRTGGGRPAAGVLGVLVDVVVGHAALAARPADHWAVTTELALEVARPLPPGPTTLTTDGVLLGAAAGSALSSGTVLDAQGRTVAVGSTRVRFTPGLPDFAEVAARPLTDRRGATTVLEVLRGALDRTDDGRWRLVLPPDPDLLNGGGVLHGGVVAAAAEVVADAATADPAAFDPANPLTLSGLRLSYLRPVLAGAGGVTLVATVEHRGRTTALTTVEVIGSDGRRAAVAWVGGSAADATT